MSKLFTKTFFRLSAYDQWAVVDSQIRDLENARGRCPDPWVRKRIDKAIKYREKKAVEYGIYEER